MANLTTMEHGLALAALYVAEAVDTAGTGDGPMSGYWAEEHTTPDTEEDVLPSTLYGGPGENKPRSGFTLWNGAHGYRVTIEPLEWTQRPEAVPSETWHRTRHP